MARYRGPAYWVVCCWGGESLGGRGTGHRPPYEPTGEPFRPGLSTHPSSIPVCLEISGCACIYRATKHINIAQMCRFSRFAWPKRLPLETFMGLCANREDGCSQESTSDWSDPPGWPSRQTRLGRQSYQCHESACHWCWWRPEEGVWVYRRSYVGLLGCQAPASFATSTSRRALYSDSCDEEGFYRYPRQHHWGLPGRQ